MTIRCPIAAAADHSNHPGQLSTTSAGSGTSQPAWSPSTLGAYAAPDHVLGDRRHRASRDPVPVALALIARIDDQACRAIDLASSLSPTVIAVHVCDPGESRATSAFICQWDAADLDVKLVLIAADSGRMGTEVAHYIQRSFPRRRVHAIACATPSVAHTRAAPADLADRPSAQLERTLHDLPDVVVHWVLGNGRAANAANAAIAANAARSVQE